MIEPASIAYDFDGVVADTMRLFIEIAWDEFNVGPIRYQDITSYSLEECLDIESHVLDQISDRIIKGKYSPELKPIDGSGDTLNKISKKGDKLLFVTARPSSGIVTDWFTDTLGMNSGSVEVVATGDFEGKTNILINRDIEYFVEDRLETCFLLKDAGITPIVFVQPWNRGKHPFMEIRDWKDLEKLLNI